MCIALHALTVVRSFPHQNYCGLWRETPRSCENGQFGSEAFPLSPEDESTALQTTQVRGLQALAHCPARRDRKGVEDAQWGVLCVSLPMCVP